MNYNKISKLVDIFAQLITESTVGAYQDVLIANNLYNLNDVSPSIINILQSTNSIISINIDMIIYPNLNVELKVSSNSQDFNINKINKLINNTFSNKMSNVLKSAVLSGKLGKIDKPMSFRWITDIGFEQ